MAWTSDGKWLESVADNLSRPFMLYADLQEVASRGRLVRLGTSCDEILTRHDYPLAVASLLGEMLALGALLATTIKFEGVFTIQAKGDGAISLMVADISTDPEASEPITHLRAYAQFDREKLGLELAKQDSPSPPSGSNPSSAHQSNEPISKPTSKLSGSSISQNYLHLLGAGYLAFTVDQAVSKERYQGIVELSGESLADCAMHYFEQSEQLATEIVLASGKTAQGWRAGGILLQVIPEEGGIEPFSPPASEGYAPLSEAAEEGYDDYWEMAKFFLHSCTASELLDRDLAADDLLYRLFHQLQVRTLPSRRLIAACRCNEARVKGLLALFPKSEREEMAVDGMIALNCEFCNRTYQIARNDLEMD